VVKPVGYEVAGVLDVLRRSVDRAERGFLVESMWKFLLYTELARSLVERLRARPTYHQHSEPEAALLGFVSKHEDLIMNPFSLRLQTAVDSLAGLGGMGDGYEQRARVSERLHEGVLTALRQHLTRALESIQRVVILVDNLDKAWGEPQDVVELSDLIFGLLSVAGRIKDEFAVSTSTRAAVDLGLVVFLRSDSFQVVQSVAREPDKIGCERLSWHDQEMLIRLLEERLLHSSGVLSSAEEVWTKFFTPMVDGQPVKEYITAAVLPRPRDIIYLVKKAIGFAANRGHGRIEEEDLRSAARAYSEYALQAITVEDDPRMGRLEAILFEFAGMSRIVSNQAVTDTILKGGASEDQVDAYRDLLCDINFLGIEADNGDFEYAIDESQRKVLSRVARTVAARTGREQVYSINGPFWSVLQIAV